MKFLKPVVFFLVLALFPSAALAQQKFEVSPFFGWRHGNDIRDTSGVSVNLESGVAYGFMVDVSITDSLQAEFIYSYRKTGGSLFVPADQPPPNGTIPFADGNVDYYQGGVLYMFDVYNPKLKPFIVGTLGAASARPANGDGQTHFSWSGGGGVKFFFTDNVGVRAEYRIFSSGTNFVGRGGWCDWWGFCYTFLTNQRLYQSQFALALILGF